MLEALIWEKVLDDVALAQLLVEVAVKSRDHAGQVCIRSSKASLIQHVADRVRSDGHRVGHSCLSNNGANACVHCVVGLVAVDARVCCEQRIIDDLGVDGVAALDYRISDWHICTLTHLAISILASD